MKRTLIFSLALALSTAGFSQSEKYMQAMQEKVALLDSGNSADGWKDLANAFERIAGAEKTQWLPYYYAAFCNVEAGYHSMPQDGTFGDNSAIGDPFADKAESLLKIAEDLSKDNPEIFCVWKMIHGLRMMGNPMNRFMTEGVKASEALERAKALNADIPRIYILEAQDKYFAPEQFGGSKTEAKTLFEKAQSLSANDGHRPREWPPRLPAHAGATPTRWLRDVARHERRAGGHVRHSHEEPAGDAGRVGEIGMKC